MIATAFPIGAIVVGHLVVGVGAAIGVGALLAATDGSAPSDLGFVTLVERIFGLWAYVAAWLLWRGYVAASPAERDFGAESLDRELKPLTSAPARRGERPRSRLAGLLRLDHVLLVEIERSEIGHGGNGEHACRGGDEAGKRADQRPRAAIPRRGLRRSASRSAQARRKASGEVRGPPPLAQRGFRSAIPFPRACRRRCRPASAIGGARGAGSFGRPPVARRW